MGAQLTNEARDRGLNESNPETTLDKMSASNSNHRDAAISAAKATRSLKSLMEEAERLAYRSRGGGGASATDLPRESQTQNSSARLEKDPRIGTALSGGTLQTQAPFSFSADKVSTVDAHAAFEARTKADAVVRTAAEVRGGSLALSGQLHDMITKLTAGLPPPGVSYADWLGPEAQAQRQKLVSELERRRSELEQTGSKAGGLEARGETFTANGNSQDQNRRRRSAA
jgi:hypothetical protein